MNKLLFFFSLALLFSLTSVGQLLNEASEEQPVSRQALIARFQELSANESSFRSDTALGQEYLTLIEKLGYHDLLADILEEELANPENASASDPEKWLLLGELHFRSGSHGAPKTEAALRRALELKENHDMALARLGQLHHREGNYDLAEEYYEQALKVNEAQLLATIGHAALQVRKGEILNSSQKLDALGVKAQPYDVETRLMLRQALHDFERRGKWFSDTAENHAAYARLLYRAGRLTDAILAARRSVVLDTAQSEIWNFLASMQLQIGNLEQAKQAYEHSLEANPNQPAIEAARRQLINTLTTSSDKGSGS